MVLSVMTRPLVRTIPASTRARAQARLRPLRVMPPAASCSSAAISAAISVASAVAAVAAKFLSMR